MTRLISDKLCECGCGEYTAVTPANNTALGWTKGSPRRFVHGHHTRADPARIFEPRHREVTASGCWIWQGYKDRQGYGRMSCRGKARGVHRVAFELVNGPVELGLVVDHICEVTSCFNPQHLRKVTHRQNIKLASERSPNEHTIEEAQTHSLEMRERVRHLWDGEAPYVVDEESGCWVWMLLKVTTKGYGRKYFPEDKKTRYAHRVVFEQHSRKIQPDEVLDHTCYTKICVNPEHLEAVTNMENVSRRWRKRKGGQ